MSTIAYRAGILAADTQATTTVKMMEGVRKIGRTEKFLFGLAGRSSDMYRIYNWVKEIENRCSPHDFYKHTDELIFDGGLDCTVFLIEENGTIWTMNDAGNVCKTFETYDATGSGQEYALGALHAGASAEESIKAASRFDIYTGGKDIHTVSFDSPVHGPTD